MSALLPEDDENNHINNNDKKGKEQPLVEEEETKTYGIPTKLFCELIGTAFLVFVGCGIPVYTNGEIISSTVGGAFIVTAMIFVFGRISGAHFNPAVSIPMFIRGKLTLSELIAYSIGQTIGAFLGSFMVALLRMGKFDKLAGTQITPYLKDLDGGEIDNWCYISAFSAETLLTFCLVMVVFASTVKANRFENITGFVIGFTLTMLIFTGFSISGSSFNPVRSIAPAVLEAFIGGKWEALKQIWIYIIGPISGGIMAALVSTYFI